MFKTNINKSKKGAALVEFGMLVGLISVAGIISVTKLGETTGDIFNTVSSEVSTRIPGNTITVASSAASAPVDPLAAYTETLNPSQTSSDVIFYLGGLDIVTSYDMENDNISYQDTLLLVNETMDDVLFSNPTTVDMEIKSPLWGNNQKIKSKNQNKDYQYLDGFGTIVFSDGTTLDRKGIRDKAVMDQMKNTSITYGSGLVEDYFYTNSIMNSITIANFNPVEPIVEKLKIMDAAENDVVFEKSIRDLKIHFPNGDILKIYKQFDSSNQYGMQTITFSDGQIYNRTDILNRANAGI